MKRRNGKSRREPTIALINIVFLMLIFFLVAGTIAAPLDANLALVRTEGIEGTAPADVLVVHADGRMTHRGIPVASAAAFFDELPQEVRDRVRIVPDRDLPAATLITLGRALREAGAKQVAIVTERGLQ
ncbi:biopolymer transporter ExbD [Sulfitobacter sp. EhC04]|uniref:ExbD/TolR family protein n=1 Tax=Sulfitobacter sp. EhC04 TaxID=1849168 RepID=UPI0007F4B682|nr:biopolymer transporter ExbD [Sulfitobacter sp. EhC04]OAN73595.1 biopolymer transporter ExbD [Sulfitobacter sp. EhC04]